MTRPRRGDEGRKVIVEMEEGWEGSVRKERRKAAEASTLGTGVQCYNRVPNRVISRRVEGQFA